MMNVWEILAILLGLFALAIVLLLLAGARAKAGLKAAFLPPGRLVDVGGHRLHIDCQGPEDTHGPTVVMDAGVGEDGLSWSLVRSEIAKELRACVYDRAGLGWSEPGPRPRTNRVMVAELHTLLERAGIPAHYILVGASLGGLNARLYAHTYPSEVAGLVLVDAAHEEQYTSEGMREAFAGILQMMPRMYGMMRLLVRSGLPALFPGRFTALVPLDPKLSKETARAIYALRVSDTRYFETAEAEMGAIVESHAQVREMNITSLGDIPLVVIQHGKVEPMQTPELTELNEQTNRRQQALVAGQSTRGKLVVADESGHAIQYEQPELVVTAIREVAAAAREGMRGREMSR
jgi:pimeloyl-ACP methyl ester carboxylesterase